MTLEHKRNNCGHDIEESHDKGCHLKTRVVSPLRSVSNFMITALSFKYCLSGYLLSFDLIFPFKAKMNYILEHFSLY